MTKQVLESGMRAGKNASHYSRPVGMQSSGRALLGVLALGVDSSLALGLGDDDWVNKYNRDDFASLPDLASLVSEPSVELPGGYKYAVTRHADIILSQAFPNRFRELTEVLDSYAIDASEILSGGGGRASHTARFDAELEVRGWGKRRITIEKLLDGVVLHRTPGHEVDMFAVTDDGVSYPGVAVEMEWNNKDPFYDRDLLNFQALHREGAIALGVIVTRGPDLQRYIGRNVFSSATSKASKYGQSSTHWDKLVPRVNLGGGGECPLILIGIEPARITTFEVIREAYDTSTRIWKMPGT